MRCERLAISRLRFGELSVHVRPHARWSLLWLWLLGACQLQSSVHSSTLLVIDIEVERTVREQSDRISITAAQAASAERAPDAIPVYAEDFMLTDVEAARVLRVVLQPRGLAAPFVAIHVSAVSAKRNLPVADARLDTRYGAGEWRVATVRLGAACSDVTCTTRATCAEGACVSAAVSWSDLPLYYPDTDAGRTQDSDAGPPPDAGSLFRARDAATVAPPLVDDSGIVTGLGEVLSDEDAGAPDACAHDHGGCDMRVSCTNMGGAPVCGTCPRGFEDVHRDGTRCDDIDECTNGLARCPEHASCENLRGDYRCACEPGYHDDGSRCAPDDTCQSDADCATSANCTAGDDGRHTCQCQAGYVGDGGQCDDVDECASGALRCGDGASCVNRNGGALCQCLLGYVMSSEGQCLDVDECAVGTADCDPSAACANTVGSFSCQCPAGFTGTGKGPGGCVAPVDNPCMVANGGCDARRDCLDTSPGPTCGDCAKGYRKDGPTGCVEDTSSTGSGDAGADSGFPWSTWPF